MDYEGPPLDDSFIPAFSEDEFFQITDQIAERVSLYGPLPTDRTEENVNTPPHVASASGGATHSWVPINLHERAANPPEPPTISNIIYPGRRHIFSGEPGSFKSWAVLVVMAEEMRKGRAVMYVDHEMGFVEMTERLKQLGTTDEQLDNLFIYIEPAEPFTSEPAFSDTVALIRERNPSLVVIDAFTGCLALHGIDPDSGVQVERFYQTVVNPLRSAGAAVVLLDHLPKNREGRGQYSINSERKVGATDVHLSFTIIQPFGRGKTGRVGIHTKRDRPGYLPRPMWGELRLESHPNTSAIKWEWREPEPEELQTDTFRPTNLMEKVSRYMETHPGSHIRKEIEDGVTGMAKFKRLAIDTLVQEGHLSEENGPNHSRINTLVKQYRQPYEPGSSISSTVRRDEPAGVVSPPLRPPTGVRAETNPKPRPKDGNKSAGSSTDATQLAYLDTVVDRTGDTEFDDGIDW